MATSNDKSAQPARISSEEYSRRCEAIFGPKWTREAAFNLGRTRQNLEAIRDGKNGVRPELVRILEGWEKRRIKIRRRPAELTRRGRPRGSRKAAVP